MSKPAVFSLLVSAMAFALAALSGCGPKVAKDPLASVGGYKLVYQQKEKRRVEPDLIASALRKRINAKNDGEVVVMPSTTAAAKFCCRERAKRSWRT